MRPLIAIQDEKEKKRLMHKHEAMMARLEKLPDDNEIIEAVLKKEGEDDKQDERYAQWAIVQDLVSTACSKFIDGELSFNDSVSQLGDALCGLGKKK